MAKNPPLVITIASALYASVPKPTTPRMILG